MSKFPRGTVVWHKVMGKGVAINEVEGGMIQVRMVNGHIEKFYPEELEAESELDARNKNEIEDRSWNIGE